MRQSEAASENSYVERNAVLISFRVTGQCDSVQYFLFIGELISLIYRLTAIKSDIQENGLMILKRDSLGVSLATFGGLR